MTPPLTKNSHFLKIGRKKFIQMDGILVRNTNTIGLSIKEGMYVHIYYEAFYGMSEYGSLEIPCPIEVLDCLVDVSTTGTFFWVIIF